jgi:hypothetical protein
MGRNACESVKNNSVAHFFMVVGVSKNRERLDHFFTGIYTLPSDLEESTGNISTFAQPGAGDS